MKPMSKEENENALIVENRFNMIIKSKYTFTHKVRTKDCSDNFKVTNDSKGGGKEGERIEERPSKIRGQVSLCRHYRSDMKMQTRSGIIQLDREKKTTEKRSLPRELRTNLKSSYS